MINLTVLVADNFCLRCWRALAAGVAAGLSGVVATGTGDGGVGGKELEGDVATAGAVAAGVTTWGGAASLVAGTFAGGSVLASFSSAGQLPASLYPAASASAAVLK